MSGNCNCFPVRCTSSSLDAIVADPANLGLRAIECSSPDLKGTIPTEIGLLTELTRLDWRQSSLVGTIPTELGALTKLESFLVSPSFLSGTLPTELKGLASLKALDLGRNRLTGRVDAAALGRLTTLTRLVLDSNGFNGPFFPTGISSLTSLRTLILTDNSFSGTIPDISALTNLQFVSIKDNRFTDAVNLDLRALTDLSDFYWEGNNNFCTEETLLLAPSVTSTDADVGEATCLAPEASSLILVILAPMLSLAIGLFVFVYAKRKAQQRAPAGPGYVSNYSNNSRPPVSSFPVASPVSPGQLFQDQDDVPVAVLVDAEPV